ncbi:MAG: IS21 family transposase [Sandaracinaceae bacterium]|nr:IS21 family transposase [Sandaracinaceae bacterium]
MHRLEELVRLHRLGTPVREVAQLLKMGPRTELAYRQALADAGLLAGLPDALPSLEELKAAVLARMPKPQTPPQQVSAIESWRPQIEKLYDKGLRPRAIHDRLRLEHEEFGGCYAQVKRLWRAIKRSRGVQPEEVAIPVETPPAEVAEVDFGYVGRLLDPETRTLRNAWCFVMVLAFSRKIVVRIVFDQKVKTWVRLHVEAFEELGGVPEVIVPDNLKAAVVRAAFAIDGDGTALNRTYRELAKHYGFKVDPTPPRAPKKKGKVESAVKYVKGSFFRGREETDAAQTARELARWVREIADQRVHGTTQRRPAEVFAEIERQHLRALPGVPYEPVVWRQAKVHTDTHVAFDGRVYSVPWRLIVREVWIRATSTTVTIYCDDDRVATHSRRGPGRRSTHEEHLPEHRRDLRHRTRSYWEERAAAMGDEVATLVREVFDSDDVLYQMRAVQAIVGFLEGYPVERARATCARASFYGITSYGGIKQILVRALDREPLPNAITPKVGELDAPRFARNVGDLISTPVEVSHEPH